MAFDFSKLNKEQLEAVMQTEGPVIVTAGAGTGKTRLLTYRIANLIQNKDIDPSRILAITFTNKATGEMRERLLSNLECGSQITVSTFHSLCVKILRSHIAQLDSSYNKFFTIYDDSDQEKVLKKIFKDAGIDDDEFKKSIAYYISKSKNEGITADEFDIHFAFVKGVDEIARYYKAYEDALKKANALDFDDLILKTLLLFKKCPDILKYYQNKFQYIHIDEFQDTNTVQYELASMLASAHHNILVVGDEDQSIYGWRGANYKNLFKFCEDFKEAKLFKLQQNYRSTSKIIDKANKLISNNRERFKKVLFTEKETGEDVDLKSFDTDLLEADFIAKQIKRQVNFGAKLSDFAVLYRVNSVSRTLEHAFINNSIPYRVFGGLKFYSRAEIKNILAYLRLLVNPNDNDAFLRIINFPKRGIGNVTCDSILNNADAQGTNCLNFVLNADKEFKNRGIEDFKLLMKDLLICLETESLSDLCQKLVNRLNLNLVYSSGTEEDLARLLNIKSFLVAVSEFEESNESPTLIDFLENISLSSEGDDDNSDGVILATVHAVKGLEFKNVFVVACEENMFPFAKSVEEGNIEEERRLMYVAITRAEEKLTLTYAKRRFSFGGGFDCYSLKSRFITEIGLKDFTESSNTSYNYSKPKTHIVTQSAGQFLQGLAQIHKASDFYDKPKNNFSNLQVGNKVVHMRFGEGIILQLKGNNALIEFENGTKKELNLDFAPIEIVEE